MKLAKTALDKAEIRRFIRRSAARDFKIVDEQEPLHAEAGTARKKRRVSVLGWRLCYAAFLLRLICV